MKLLKIAAIAAFICSPMAAVQAQTASANSGSISASSAGASSGSSSILYLDQRSPESTKATQTISGTRTLKTAPPVTAPSMGSGHPCGLATSGGVSIIGGGLSAGQSRVDEACLLAQMGQGEAALIMIAQRDPDACKALRQVGRIGASSVCTPAEKRAARQTPSQRPVTTSSRSAAAPVMIGYSKCERGAGNIVKIRYKRGVDKAAVKAQCLSVLGY